MENDKRNRGGIEYIKSKHETIKEHQQPTIGEVFRLSTKTG